MSIKKETAFRDSIQPFSNVYFLTNGALGGMPNASDAGLIIDHLVTFEKSIHSTAVTFAYARCWNVHDINALSNMLNQKALSGVGSAAAIGGMDKERAYLFRWRAGVDSRGNPVYLRKWYHTCGAFGVAQTAIPQGVMENISSWTLAARQAMEAKADDLNNFTVNGTTWDLCSETGRVHDNASCTCHQYLEHHQMGDAWRGD